MDRLILGKVTRANWFFLIMDKDYMFALHRQEGWENLVWQSSSWENFLQNAKRYFEEKGVFTDHYDGTLGNFIFEKDWHEYDILDSTVIDNERIHKKLIRTFPHLIRDALKKGEDDTLIALALCCEQWGPEIVYKCIPDRFKLKASQIREKNRERNNADEMPPVGNGELHVVDESEMESGSPIAVQGGLVDENVKSVVSNIRYQRDTLAIESIKEKRGYRCQICGASILKSDGTCYVEGAHIIPKKDKGAEVPSNILVLCPNHHAEFDMGDKEIISHSESHITFRLNGKVYTINLN